MQKMMQNHRNFNTMLLPTASIMQRLDSKNIHITSVRCISTVKEVQRMGFTERILRKTGIIDVQKYVIEKFLY